MHWKSKAAAFRLLEMMPFGASLHYMMQRHLTRTWPRKTQALDALTSKARWMVDMIGTHGVDPSTASVLEVGAGRDLCVPLALRAFGVGHVTTIDLNRIAKIDLVAHSARRVAETTGVHVPAIGSWEDLASFGIDYRAPARVVDVHRPVDAVVSNEVLEHVPLEGLGEILTTLQPYLHIHTIDYSDHFARGGDVTRFNFLQFDDEEWSKYNSSYQYLNRLRHQEYVGLLENAGYEAVVVETREQPWPAGLVPASRFAGRADLEILSARIVARRTMS